MNLNDLPHEFKDIKKIDSNKNFQKVERDFAFIVNKNISSQTIIKSINEKENDFIDEVNIFDVYEGEGIPEGKKSIAVNVIIQSMEKTLSEKDINDVSQKIINIVKAKTGGTIRS